MGVCFFSFSAWIVLSVGACCFWLSVVVKNVKRTPTVKTNAENIDKKDKESLNALSDKIPPPQIKYRLIIIIFFKFNVNERGAR